MRGNSRWWARCRHICGKYGLDDLLNVTWLRDISVQGLMSLGLCLDSKKWKKETHEKIESKGRDIWRRGFNRENMREQEYLEKKPQPMSVEYARYGADALVRLMVRGGCMQVRAEECMRWKYDCDKCVCGEIESESHVLFECMEYISERNAWRREWSKVAIDELDCIKGYLTEHMVLDKCTLKYLGAIWRKRLKLERNRTIVP